METKNNKRMGMTEEELKKLYKDHITSNPLPETQFSAKPETNKPIKGSIKEKAIFVASSLDAARKRRQNDWDSWNNFPTLGLPLGIGKAPLASIGEHHEVIRTCITKWKAPLEIVVSALNPYEHEATLGVKVASQTSWNSNKSRKQTGDKKIKFINVPLPDFIKNIKPDLQPQISELAQTVVEHWSKSLSHGLDKELFTAWRTHPINAELIDNKLFEPKTVYFHCKAGQTRSVTLALCCLAAMYVELNIKYGNDPTNAQGELSNELLAFINNVTYAHLRVVRPQVDMKTTLIHDIIDFGLYYYKQKALISTENNFAKSESNESNPPFKPFYTKAQVKHSPTIIEPEGEKTVIPSLSHSFHNKDE